MGKKWHGQPDTLRLGTTAFCTPTSRLQLIGTARRSARGRRSGLGRVRKGPRDLHEAKMKMGAANWWGQKDRHVCAGEKGGQREMGLV